MDQDIKRNAPINELRPGEDAWLPVAVLAVRERRSQQSRRVVDASARNRTGNLALRVRSESLERSGEIRPGIWAVAGRVETGPGGLQLAVSEYEPITLDEYRKLQGEDPVLPLAYTLDIETIALAGYRERVPAKLERLSRLDRMDASQEERYSEDRLAEEERVYRSGGLAATTGRILSIAVHVGPIPGIVIEGLERRETEYAFGIDSNGAEEGEAKALIELLQLVSGLDPETDQIVGHNIVGFDLPFICQRCLVNGIPARPMVSLAEHGGGVVFDTMHRWWLGSRNRVSLDDLAWALGLESSKTAEIEGSRIFDMYHAGRLAEIREYNLNDARLTRKVYERMVSAFGR